MSKSRAAIERAQESSTANGKKAIPGRYFVAEPKVIDGGEMPTLHEWVEEQERKSGMSAPVTKFGTNSKHNIVQGKNA